MSRITARTGRTLVATSALAVALTVAAPLAANADPSSARTYEISGSDTIQDAVQAIAESGIPSPSLGSWYAFGSPDPITPKSGGQSLGRPHGSGDGVKALSASWNPNNDVFSQTVNGVTTAYDLKNNAPDADGVRELDFARSSSKPGSPVLGTSGSNHLTFVPFARDAVAPVLQKGSGTTYDAITNLTNLQLGAVFGNNNGNSADGVITRDTASSTNDPVYNTHPGFGDNQTIALDPVLPQTASGTRQFFLSAIGVTTVGDWVTGKTTGGVGENDASQIDTPGQLAPFSAAQWIAQKNLVAPDTFTGTNSAHLTLIEADGVLATTGTAPSLAPNSSYYGPANLDPADASFGTHPYARDTYIVVPTANYASQATYVKNLGQTTHGIPAKYYVQDYGFLRLNYTASSTQGQYYSDWTN